MSTSTITVGGQSITLVSVPTSPAFRSVQFSAFDAVGSVPSVFTGQMQVQQWPGADLLSGTMTLPTLNQAEADDWIAFLMQCQGMANAFQMGDPTKSAPRGSGAGSPVTSSASGVNQAAATTLTTSGWTSSAVGVLLRGDMVQVSYRLYRVLDDVTADGSGNAAIPIWPSIRETLTGGTAITLSNPKGLFRLANNKRDWSADFTRRTSISIPIQEYR